MFAVIELPHLPLQAAALNLPAPLQARPVVVLDGTEDRVITLNRAARTAGVETGTTAAGWWP